MVEVPAQVQDSKTTKINLDHDVTVNSIKYRAGQGVEVPKNQAEDILRIAHDYSMYEKNLMRKNNYEVNAGTIAMGGE